MKRHLILFFSALAGIATAENVMHNMVSRHTPVNTNLIGAVIGEGLSLSNGVLSSTGGGGGGIDGETVTNIVKGVVADAGVLVTNAFGEIEAALKVGDLYSDGEINLAGALLSQFGQLYYRNSLEEYDPEREVAVKGDIPDLTNYDGDIHTGGGISAGAIDVQGVPVATQADISGFAVRTNLPPISATATVGDLVDAYNGIVNALKEEP